MYLPNQKFRRATTYNGEHSNFNDVSVIVQADKGEDDDGDLWLIQLPITGKQVTVYGDELSPAPADPELFIERLTRLVTFHHPLLTGFVAEAIGRYADQVLADPEETKRQMATGFISGEAWLECAKTAKAVMATK